SRDAHQPKRMGNGSFEGEQSPIDASLPSAARSTRKFPRFRHLITSRKNTAARRRMKSCICAKNSSIRGFFSTTKSRSCWWKGKCNISGTSRPPISRRAWRNRHHQRGTLSPGCCRCCATAKRNAPTFDHNLSASERAAFIAESIQGVGGCIVFPDGYLKHAYEHVRAAGGLCIADEVQAG